MNNKYFTYTKQTLNKINEIKFIINKSTEYNVNNSITENDKSNSKINYSLKQCKYYKEFLVDEIFLHQMNADERKIYNLLRKSDIYNVKKIIYHNKYIKIQYKLTDFGIYIKQCINEDNLINDTNSNTKCNNVKVNKNNTKIDVNIILPKVSTNLYDCYNMLTKLKTCTNVNDVWDESLYKRTLNMLTLLKFDEG